MLTFPKGNNNRSSSIIFNIVNAIHSLIARIDDIDNKLHRNQKDINFHLSRLKFFTKISDEDEEKPIMNIINELTQHIPKNILMNDNYPCSKFS
ncbi:11502_t:CDS:2 [Funneliformis mosseae]|uniref:11502_t:CDS:1 n=1 Tax=Funneliformis mosseae TaxID=27381 RepID=A0A9N9GSB8_FUNMO|nr:11502_t:CDS:2 [Funneliformis mosseae]